MSENHKGERPRRFIGPVEIEFDLSYSHERNYFSRSPARPVPQADIDTMIFRRFIRSGDIVLDGGGNIGVTAAEMIEAGASEVHVFEPHPQLAERLEKLQSERIRVYAFGLSDRDGEVEFYESQSHNQGSTINVQMIDTFPAVFAGHVPTYVEVRRLDSACLGVKFDFMKIDIEGAEAAFLRGAQNALAIHPPRAIVMELYDPFFQEVYQEASRYYRHCLRALISREDYSLRLIDHTETFDPALYHPTSPTFVFTDQSASA